MIDRIAEIWGTRTPYAQGERWPVRVDSVLAEGVAEEDVDRWVQSACVLCSNGCGTDIAVKDGRMVGVRGRSVDIVNHGRLGPKGLFGSWQGVANGDRLTRPLIREGDRLTEALQAAACPQFAERVNGHLLTLAVSPATTSRPFFSRPTELVGPGLGDDAESDQRNA